MDIKEKIIVGITFAVPIGIIIFNIALVVALIWIAYHFISKLW